MYPDGSSQFQYDAIPETRIKKPQYDKSNGGATSLSWIRDCVLRFAPRTWNVACWVLGEGELKLKPVQNNWI